MSTDIDNRINEAEVCRSMGLYSDSLAIYEAILPSIADNGGENLDTIKKRIGLLKQEIEKDELNKPAGVSKQDISMFKQTLSTSKGDAAALLDSATAFQEMGLHSEAVAEFAKLLTKDHPKENVVPQIAKSLLKHKSAEAALGDFKKTIKKTSLEKVEAGQVYFLIGQEMEKREMRDRAHDFYKIALETDPKNAEAQKRLDSIAASYASGSKYDFLLREKMVTTDQLQKAFAMSKKMNCSVEHVLLDSFQVKKDALAKSFSLFYGCKFVGFDPEIPKPVELLANLKKAFLMNEIWVPLSWSKEGIEVLVDDPRNLNKTDNIKSLMRTSRINFLVAIREDIQEFIRHFYSSGSGSDAPTVDDVLDDMDLIPDVSFEEEEEEAIPDDIDEASSQVVKLVDQFIIAAYRKDASDIHIEPSPITKATTVRFRLDGVCQEYMKAPNSMVRGIVSRIKIMANLDIAERRLPQDGKIKFRRKGVPPFEMRVATLPTAGGFEDVVLRILASAGAMKLDEMGLTQRNEEVMKRIIAKPYGLVLAVGPTGSGKTTSLHAILGHINKPGIKIWTAEDPIEITQGGLRQVEVKPKIGLNFARVMRAFLRADPDIIMIGEMRDEETASIGIEASLTGHLVFSTLHTNSAPETITRLLDMGLNPLNFSDAFLGVLAQRLTRRLCTNCAEEYSLTKDEFEEMRQDYGPEYFDETGIEYSPDVTISRASGCESCSNTGYRGRMGIHELMEGSPEIKLMIKKQSNTEELLEIAQKQGMSTLKQDGLLKVFEKITDIAEVRRVCIK